MLFQQFDTVTIILLSVIALTLIIFSIVLTYYIRRCLIRREKLNQKMEVVEAKDVLFLKPPSLNSLSSSKRTRENRASTWGTSMKNDINGIYLVNLSEEEAKRRELAFSEVGQTSTVVGFHNVDEIDSVGERKNTKNLQRFNSIKTNLVSNLDYYDPTLLGRQLDDELESETI
ncbi:hypothetical protein HK099_002038, partial [Clydaea vesicula]